MALTFFYFFVLTASTILFVRLFRGAIYVPTGHEAVRKIVALAAIEKGNKTVDLGSGDGRIVIAMAKAGAEAHGFEHDPFLVWLSRRKVRQAGLSGKAFIHKGNFWDEDFSRYNVVTVFGISRIMKKLEAKLDKETKSGTRVVSYLFHFPNWRYCGSDGGAYLYKK